MRTPAMSHQYQHHDRQTYPLSDPMQKQDQDQDQMILELQLQHQHQHTTQDLDPNSDSHNNGIPTDQLPPVDGGLLAWRLLLAAFIFEALFWGFPSSFGVFQNYYTSHPLFHNSTTTTTTSSSSSSTTSTSSSQIALIGTSAQATCYLGAPLSALLTRRFPRFQTHQIYIGWALSILGLLSASFTQSTAALVITQGVLYGTGFVVLTYPIISMVDEWWVSRKGMAFGLISAASGAAGCVMPFVLEAMLERYGFRVTLRASAGAMVVMTAPLLPLLRGRLPVSASASTSATLARTDWSFVRKPLFWVYALAVLVHGLGFFFPAVFLPSYASLVGIDSTKGALLLAIMSVAQVLGQFAFGYLSDKDWSVSVLAGVCSFVSSLAAFAIWGVSRSIGLLVLFSMLYGFFGYGFGTMRVAMGRAVSDDPSAVVATYAIFVFLQGVGNVLVSPLSARLIHATTSLGSYAAGQYGLLVLFTGSCLLSSAIVIWLWHSLSFAVKKLPRF